MRACHSAMLLVPALIVGGCAAGSRNEIAALSAKQDSLLVRMAGMSQSLDSARDDIRKIRLLTDFVGTKLARQERMERQSSASETETVPVAIEAGASFARGSETAPVVMVTFSDLECPYCRKLAPALDSFSRRHDTDLRWVAKNLPLESHPNARMAASAAIAAGRQGRYFEFLLRASRETGALERERLDSLAREIGLDMKKFRADFGNPRTSAPLLADEMNEATRIGVRGTPTVFLDGRMAHVASVADLEKAYLSARSRTFDSREKQ